MIGDLGPLRGVLVVVVNNLDVFGRGPGARRFDGHQGVVPSVKGGGEGGLEALVSE